ncbi:hypothetical protein NXW78_07150 [Bacteroides ovatus]|nr:hypothetical protein [Bacteroides ovatus]
MELSYKNAAVLIKYSPLDYIFPKGYKYAYRMEGLDQNWNYIERNEVIYSHLPAGEYTFYIKACNSDGIWGGCDRYRCRGSSSCLAHRMG